MSQVSKPADAPSAPPEYEYLQFGGMALPPKGVMMRSPNFFSVAARAPGGQIVVTTEPLDKTALAKLSFLKRPFLRGILGMLDTMILGNRAMKWSAGVEMEGEAAIAGVKTGQPQSPLEYAVIGALVVSLAFFVLIFRFGPELLAQGTKNFTHDSRGTLTNYVAEGIKILIFMGYLLLIRRWGPILEVFKYHGAEHKAINVVEAKQDLTVENALPMTRLHPRCGTNFAIIVLLIGLVIFPLIPRFGNNDAPWIYVVVIRLGIELCVLPFIAGVAYEIIRAAGKAKNQMWVNVLLWPGLMTQYITTEPPRGDQIEVAIASLKAVMLAEENGQLTEVPLDTEALMPKTPTPAAEAS